MYGEIWLEKHRFKFYFVHNQGMSVYHTLGFLSQPQHGCILPIYRFPKLWHSYGPSYTFYQCFGIPFVLHGPILYTFINAVSNHIQMHEIFKLVWWVFKLAFHAFNHATIDTFCLVYYISFPLKVSWFCSYLSWLFSIQRWGDLQTSILQVS